MVVVLFLALASILIANVILIAGLYFLSAAILRPIVRLFHPTPTSRLWRWGAPAALAAIIMFALPVVLNSIRQHERRALTSEDRMWKGSFSNLGVVALLTNRPADGSSGVDWRACDEHRCKGLLYGHKATAFLIGSPPPIGTPLEPTLKVTRYRIEHRDWCPPLEDIDDHRNGRNLAELMRLAQGECLIGEPATLAEADIVVVDQLLNPPGRPLYHTVHEAITGERLSLYKRQGSSWHELFRKTDIGGADWSVPMHVGFLDRNLFGAMMFGGSIVGFATAGITEAKPIDLEARLKRWGLTSPQGVVAEKSAMTPLAWKIEADTNLPSDTAAMQFLATYVWSGGWDGKDRALQAAIIRDPRVTEFPIAPWDKTTPVVLAGAILDRIMATDLTAPDPPSTHPHGNRAAARTLAEVFSLLPPGAAAPLHRRLMLLAADRSRRQYVPALFSRLADAGLPAIGDVEDLIRTGLAEGDAASDKRAWAIGDGCDVALALYGLTQLGPDAQSALPVVLAAIKDNIAKAYPGNELRIAGYLVLLHMGKLDLLKRFRPEGDDYILKNLDRNARWEIGQCGRFR